MLVRACSHGRGRERGRQGAVVLLLPARGAGAERRPARAHHADGVLEGHGVAVLRLLRAGQPRHRGEADHGLLRGPRAHGHQDPLEDERVQGRRRRRCAAAGGGTRRQGTYVRAACMRFVG
jgi:hypothetical protein